MQLCVYLGLILFIIIVLGVAGNGISMLVWIKGRRCRKSPCAIFLRALSVSDTFALCIPALNEAVGLIVGAYPNHQNIIICKTEVFGRHFGLLVSSWIIVFFSIERTLSVLQPLKQRWWDNKRNSAKLICGIFIFVFVLNIPYAFVYDIVPVEYSHNRSLAPTTNADTDNVPGQNRSINSENFDRRRQDHNVKTECKKRSFNLSALEGDTDIANVGAKNVSLDDTTDIWEIRDAMTITENNTRKGAECGSNPSSLFSFYNWYHIWLMDFALIFVLPFTIITACNVTVIYFIVCLRKDLSSAMGSRRALAVTKRAIAVSVMHCITTGPFSVFVLIPGLAEKAFGVKYSTEFYLLTGVMIFAYLNHGINYILYSVFGSDFRRDCVELFRLRPVSLDMPSSFAVSKSEELDRKRKC